MKYLVIMARSIQRPSVFIGQRRGGAGTLNLATVAALVGKFAMKSFKRRTLFGRLSARKRICLQIYIALATGTVNGTLPV